MKIATWNLERPKPQDIDLNAARLEKIRQIDADIWIFTETHEAMDLSATHHGAATTPSPRKPRPGESCATIWSRWPILQTIPTTAPTEAVCVEVAHPQGSLLVYGSIIAYHGYKGPDGTSPAWHEHYRYIQWHGEDWLRLRKDYPKHRLITGGDYNQSRDGSGWYGNPTGRDMLSAALHAAGLTCVTEENFRASGKLQTRGNVDHLCVDTAWARQVISVSPWEAGVLGTQQLSDHNGVMVEIGW